MTCIKTGCLVYLEQYGEWAYGDAHQYDNMLVVRTVWRGRSPDPEFGPNRHFTIHTIAEWWDGAQHFKDNSLTGTLIVKFWTDHGMDGTPESLLRPVPAATDG